MKKTLLFIGLCLSLFVANAQTYTFECVASGRLSGDSCDICPSTIVETRSFNGLVIFKDSVFYRWLDQPYSIRTKPGGIVEYWEHGANPYSERVTIPLSLTGFSTIQGMADSTWCNSSAPNRFQRLTLDSLNATQAVLSLSGDNSDEILEEGMGITFSYEGDTITINSTGGGGATDLTFTGGSSPYTLNSSTGTDVTFSQGAGIALTRLSNDLAIAAVDASITNEIQQIDTFTIVSNVLRASLSSDGVPFKSVDLSPYVNPVANNGLSDNEAGGGVFRLGNRYMNGSDGLFSNDRKVNLNASMAFFGDNSDSTLLTIDGTNDRIGIGMLPANRLDVSGASGTYIRVGTAGAVANAGLILNNSADVADTWAVYRQGDGDFAIGADADNEWPNGTLTDPFIIKPSPPSNSFYMDATGKVQLGGTSPQRTLHVTGEARITDLVTDNPTVLVGADADGDLSAVTLGTGLSYTGTTLNATGGSFYQTMRDNGTGETQRAALNFISSSTVSALLTDDAGNNETEVTFAIPNNAISNALLRQGVARSVIGVTGNATANVADIQGTTDQVLRVNTTGNALAFGQIATGGITDDAVTYAKIQNVVNDERLLGRVSGANGIVEELTQAQVQTFLGITGTANRFAIFPTATTISTNAAFTFTTGPDRVTFTGSAAGSGANNAFLNLNSGAITGTTEFLRMSGNINGNMYAGMLNSNNSSASNHTIFQILSGGTSAGDALIQFTVSGAMTHAIGIDNTNDRFCITPNATTPGASSNGITVYEDGSSIGAVGINNNFPVHPLTVEGRARADLFLGEGNEYSSGNVSFGTGAGTGPSLTQIVGTGNAVMVRFSTGTTPTANGNIFTITYPTAFLTASMVNFSAGCNNASAVAGDNTATDFLKFKISTSDATTFIFKAVGTLAASTAYALTFNVFGY